MVRNRWWDEGRQCDKFGEPPILHVLRVRIQKRFNLRAGATFRFAAPTATNGVLRQKTSFTHSILPLSLVWLGPVGLPLRVVATHRFNCCDEPVALR